MLITSVYCIIGSFLFDDWNFILHTGTNQIFNFLNIIIILYISFGATCGSLLTQFNGQKYMNNTTKSAIIYALEPVFATMFGIIFGDEIITISIFIGSLFIFVGIIISQFHPRA
jgi:drug/metabolite transporter (DMT)-like permease